MELTAKFAWLFDLCDGHIPDAAERATLPGWADIEFLAREYQGEVAWPLDYPPDAPADKAERWRWLSRGGHRRWETAGGTTLEVVK